MVPFTIATDLRTTLRGWENAYFVMATLIEIFKNGLYYDSPAEEWLCHTQTDKKLTISLA